MVFQDFPRLDSIPFESQYQYMATLHALPEDSRMVYLKGSFEKILAKCDTQLNSIGEKEPLALDEIKNRATDMAKRGLRVLAFASLDIPNNTEQIDHTDISESLTFLGLQAMIDPPRKEAMNAIRDCYAAGIHVKMITGDHVQTC